MAKRRKGGTLFRHLIFSYPGSHVNVNTGDAALDYFAIHSSMSFHKAELLSRIVKAHLISAAICDNLQTTN
jgi:hypothetical protein